MEVGFYVAAATFSMFLVRRDDAFYFFLEIFGSIKNSSYFCTKKSIKLEKMEPKIGDKMKVSPQLTAQPDWIDGEVIDVEHNPFIGLVISIKDKLGRIFFGQSRFFVAL